MKIAYTSAEGKGATDRLIAEAARRLEDLGLRLAGTVQVNSETCEGGLCDMDVRVLSGGPVLRISQSLGKGARGCRLDPEALEAAVGHVARHLQTEGADILIVNKFGRHEAEGHGFREVIAEALAREIPVLVGINALNVEAFETFTEGLGLRLDPDPEILVAWAREAVGKAAA